MINGDADKSYASVMQRLAALQSVQAVPGVRRLRQTLYEKLFHANTQRNMFRGVYPDYAAAQASAPSNRSLGYDNAESAAMYFGHMSADSYDYPAIFWLERSLLAGKRSVFDVGGHIGIKYYAFKELLSMPTDLNWTVCDVPAVIQRGQSAAAKRDPRGNLRFTSDYAVVEGFDLLFASGVVQYLPMTLQEWLGPIRARPGRIIFNTTAIHPSKSFFTLNSIGTAYCPYRVTSEPDFLAQMAALGYEKVDQWTTPGKGSLRLPLDPEYEVQDYSGYVFDRC
jgi:putative methyltransferase (TIGR04325 family)